MQQATKIQKGSKIQKRQKIRTLTKVKYNKTKDQKYDQLVISKISSPPGRWDQFHHDHGTLLETAN